MYDLHAFDSPYMVCYWCLIVTYALTLLFNEILQNLNDTDVDLSMSPKVKCYSVIGLPKYGFLLVSNCNTWPNSAPLQDISFQNLSDLDINLSRSLRSNVIAPMDPPYMLPY